MNIKKLNYGEKVRFEIGEEILDSIYVGKFDFLYCFETKIKTLPKVTTLNEKTKEAVSIVIANFEMLKAYGLSDDEIKAILYHEEGHILSVGQRNKNGIELEYDADNYALSFVGTNTLISALEKTKEIVINESKNKQKIPDRILNLEKRIQEVKVKEKKKDGIER